MAQQFVAVVHDGGLTATVPESALSVYEKSGWRRAEHPTASQPASRRPRRSTPEPTPVLPTTTSEED